MRKLLTLFTLLLLAGCGGGGNVSLATLPPGQPEPAMDASSEMSLVLTVETAGDAQRVVLSAVEAADLYQLAGSVIFDAGRYQLLEAISGGGLGDAADSYFACVEIESGRLDFAYTRRYYGSGVNGEVRLLEVLVSPSEVFSLSDFALSREPGTLLARDSARRELAITVPEVQR